MNTELQNTLANCKNLPSLPTVAAEIIQLTSQDDFGLNDLTDIVRNDMAIATKLIATANTVAYRGNEAVTEISNAVARLGFKSTVMIALSFSLAVRGEQTKTDSVDTAALWELSHGSTKSEPQPGQDAKVLHQSLFEIWRDLLGHTNFDLESEFSEVGGDSLALMELIAETETLLQIKLNPTELPSPLTIRSLADSVSGERVACVDKRTRAFFISTPAARKPIAAPILDAISYEAPARQLHIDPKLLAREDPHRVFTDWVEDLVGQILQVPPSGPFRLAGFSFTGLLAMEVARALRKVGHEVELLVLLDSFFGREGVSEKLQSFLRQNTKEKAARVRAFLPAAHQNNDSKAGSIHRIEDIILHAKQLYQPLEYDGRTLVIRSSGEAFRNTGDWSGVLVGPWNKEVVEGGHMDLILKPESISHVARCIAFACKPLQSRSL